MGSGASIPDKIDLDTCKKLAGERFNQEKFDALKKDAEGKVSKEDFLALAAADGRQKKSRISTKSRDSGRNSGGRGGSGRGCGRVDRGRGRGRGRGKGLGGGSGRGNASKSKVVANDETSSGASPVAQSTSAMKAENTVTSAEKPDVNDSAASQVTPAVHSSANSNAAPSIDSSPPTESVESPKYTEGGTWEIDLTELLNAISAAHEFKKTPLVIDRSAAHKVDAFFSYKAGHIVDAKAVSLKLARGSSTQEEAQHTLRHALSFCMQKGLDLVISCQQASPSFSSNLCCDTFPLEVFKEGGACLKTNEWADKIVLDEHSPEGVKLSRENFTVTVTSWFSVENLDDFFFAEGMGFEKMPKEDFQLIVIKHPEGEDLLD
mmetsp:Transcript_11507/g.16983  ORF Transcript_11507/g.16983 Transcript_11507/m.16983 type:complete len:377 (-) Transcript_11507:61-1191(-)